MTEILKVLVGSRAHGLADEDSDWDYRRVFVAPTNHILQLGRTLKQSEWEEGDEGNTSYEIGHFLHLATECNPAILEVLTAPVVGPDETEGHPCPSYPWGYLLRALFSSVWNSMAVYNAHFGYSRNQQKKLRDDPSGNRAGKYASAELRALYQGYSLLAEDVYTVDFKGTPVFHTLKAWRQPDSGYSLGDVTDACEEWRQKMYQAYTDRPDKETDLEVVNDFLLKVRREFWEAAA